MRQNGGPYVRTFFWGYWWIVPLIGFALCIAFMAFRVSGAGSGFMCMGRRGNPPDTRGVESR